MGNAIPAAEPLAIGGLVAIMLVGALFLWRSLAYALARYSVPVPLWVLGSSWIHWAVLLGALSAIGLWGR